MAKNMQAERRRFQRAERKLCIHHRLYKRKGRLMKDSWHWHLSTTENMSAAGILFHSDVPYKKSDILELRVVVSGILDIFDGLARIVRIKKTCRGLDYSTAVSFCPSTRQTKAFKKLF